MQQLSPIRQPRRKNAAYGGILTARRRYIVCLLIAAGMICGCGNYPHRKGWGQSAALFPGWRKAGTAARNAILSPETWAPLAAALFVQIDDMDSRITEWASDTTPIFGSNEHADDWSDYLRDATGVSYAATALADADGRDFKQRTLSTIKGISVGAAAIGLTVGTTTLIKSTTDRTRPNGADDKSFVSGHTSSAAGFATLSRKNLEYVNLSHGAKKLLSGGFTGLAALTGWARVEAGQHYLSDVLAGYALGHFICAVVNDTFLGADDQNLHVTIAPSKEGILLGVGWAY